MFRYVHPCPPKGTARDPFLVAWTLLALLALVACESPRERTVKLDTAEQRLVNETVELARIRVERTRDPQLADSLLAALPSLYDEAQREALLDRLAEDTPRGAAVLAAIHDSLEALRDRIFPPGTPQTFSESSGDASPD